MDIALVVLQVLFFVPVLVRLVARRGAHAAHGRSRLAELGSVVRTPALVVHGAGLAVLWAGVGEALLEHRVDRHLTVRGSLGAVIVIWAAILIASSVAVFRSWRLLPKIDADHELCTTGPYAIVRHPIYLAVDLVAVGTAVWVTTVPTVIAAILVVVGGELRARLEEQVLVEAFGDRYRDYMTRVPRMVPFRLRVNRH